MSNAVFPTLPGLAWSVTKTPQWSTRIQQAVSGREYRAAYYNVPLWTFSMSYDVLRSSSAYLELQTLVGFFNARQGSYDSFLFTDPTDNSVSDQQFGTGDGSTLTFQLLRTIGGYSEPIQNVNGTPSVFMDANDWRGEFLLSSSSRTNLFTNSNAFHLSSWTKNNNTWTSPYYSLAPDGTYTASLLTEGTGTSVGYSITNSTPSYVAGQSYTFSCFAKESGLGSKRYFTLVFPTTPFGGVTIGATFDLATGTVTKTSGAVTVNISTAGQFPNGFYLCSITATATVSGSGSHQIRINSSSASITGTYSGDNLSSFIIFGARTGLADYRTPYLPSNPTFTSRTGVATYFDVSGTLQTAATGVARSSTYDQITHASIGLMLENSATNSIRNNTMAGVASGTPGTLPTNWGYGNISGLSSQIVGSGTQNGINYVDIRLFGTTSRVDVQINMDTPTAITAATGDTWTHSHFVALVGGSLTNISSVNTRITERDSGGTSLVFSESSMPVSSTLTRYAYAYKLVNASTARVQGGVSLSFANGVAIDVTLRIGMPQLELGKFSTSVIATSSAAVTRNADSFSAVAGTAAADYTLGSTGILTFGVAPIAASVLTWTGSFYFRCRFLQDSMEFENFMKDLWQAKKVEFMSVKL